ncbi:hypothetical protein ACTA71_004314 [Dictyostelium dimigraforme]
MNTKIFVSRLPWAVCKEALKNHFSQYGTVKDGYVVLDRITKRSKGFGFVTFDSADSANTAINADNEMEGRKLIVNIALDKEKTPRYNFSLITGDNLLMTKSSRLTSFTYLISTKKEIKCQFSSITSIAVKGLKSKNKDHHWSWQ